MGTLIGASLLVLAVCVIATIGVVWWSRTRLSPPETDDSDENGDINRNL